MTATNNAALRMEAMGSVRRDGVLIGRVVSTTGSQIVALLDGDVGDPNVVQMGSLVSVCSPHANVYGIIAGLSTPMPRPAGEGPELKIAEISLLGEVADRAVGGNGAFRRGVSKLPSLDARVYMADQDETAIVYAFPSRPTVCIGSVHQDPRVPAFVSVDDLLGKHFAILGTTGSGKSCALTLVLKQIFKQNPNSHVLLLDPHGEYGCAFGSSAEHLTIESFRLPYWLLNFDEFVEVLFGNEKAEMGAEVMQLRELVLNAKLRFHGNGRDANWVTVDSPVPYSLGDLTAQLDRAIGGLDNRGNLPTYLRLKARLAALQTDRRYAFMFDLGIAVRDNLGALLGRLFRVPANGKPLAILHLVSIPSEALNVVVAVVCRLAFDFAVLSGRRAPLLLVCEEAHRYAPRDTASGFEAAKRALLRIAKEGRKYGISLGVISQRPFELASNILSQCNTVFAFRMSNERDQEIIQATMSETTAAIFSALPLLGNSEAIAIGEGVPIPMRLRFAEVSEGERPRSSSAKFCERWKNADIDAANDLDRIVDTLRGRKVDLPSKIEI